MDIEEYEKIYIGSSPIMMLDAINSNLNNQKVLIIDKSNDLGGAWKTIDLFGCSNVENAVHYLLPNKKGYEFLENIFNVELEGSKRKYYAVKIFGFKLLISVRKKIGKIIYLINGGDQREYLSIKNFIKNLFLKGHVYRTKYPRKGTSLVIEKIKNKIKSSSIKLKLNEEVLGINIINNKAFIETNLEKFSTKQIFISHGFIPPKKFFINNEKVILNLKKHPRPSLHINSISKRDLRKYFIPYNFSQALFPKGSDIKYVHQISQFIKINERKFNQQIVVVALRHDLRNCYENYIKIADELESFGLIPKVSNRSNEDFYWQDILIPQLDSCDLDYLSKKSKDIIVNFKTECLNTSFGEYCKLWKFKNDFF